MTALAMIAASAGRRPCTISADLSATASAGTATSSTVTIGVPGGNTGQIRINFSDIGTILLARQNKNGAGFANFSDGDIITFTNGQTLALQTTGDNAGESRTYTLTDVDTNRTITPNGTAVHTGA